VTARARPVRVTVEARAKLNLGLAVGPRRADGFHDLATIFQSISLADHLGIEPRRGGFTLSVRHENVACGGDARLRTRAPVPRGADNLVLRAARLLRASVPGIGGAHFTLVKRIPARAGLGGGSADAAAALAGLAASYGVRLAPVRRRALAAQLGSDVPFALTGGTALGLGRGEILKPLRLARPFRAVVAVPVWSVSTADAFARVDRNKNNLTRWTAHLRFAQVLGRERIIPERAMRLGNTFETALGHRRRDFEALCATLRECGAVQVRLTGSGSAAFALLPQGVRGMDFVRRVQGSAQLFLVRSTGRGPVVTART